MEGQSSGIFSGGFTATVGPSVPGLVPFADVEIRRNRLTFPYAWLGMNAISSNAHWNGANITRKNVEEIQSGQRVLYSGNIFENVDNSGGQSGPLADWTVRNNSTGWGTFYSSIISDITFTNNIARNGCEGLETDKSSPIVGAGGGASYGVTRSLFYNNLLYGVTASNPGCAGVASQGIFLSNSQGFYWQGTVTENAGGTGETFVANCSVNAGGCPGQVASIAVGTAGTGCVAGNLVISAPNIAGGFQLTGSYTCSGGVLATVTLTNPQGNGVLNGSGYVSPPTITLATGTGTVIPSMVGSTGCTLTATIPPPRLPHSLV